MTSPKFTPRKVLDVALSAVEVIVGLTYPLLIWYGLTHLRPRQIALFILAILLPLAVRRFYRAQSSQRWVVVQAPAAAISLMFVSAIADDARLILALPVLVNILFLLSFGRSLSTQPMAERYARMVHPDLSPAEIGHCRQVTAVWCGFFVANAAVAAALALWAPFAWWAIYTGIIGYTLMGLLFIAEYLVRISRFGRRPTSSPMAANSK